MKNIKKKIFITIVLILTVFIFTSKVKAAHMWIQCNDYDLSKGNADYRVYNTFGVFNDRYDNPRLIAFVNENNLLETVDISFKLEKWMLTDYISQGPTLMATKDHYLNGKECWMTTDDTSEDCWNKDTVNFNEISTMIIDGYCPVYVEKSGDFLTDTSRFIKFWGKTLPQYTNSFNENQFIIYKFTTEGQTYVQAEGYDANTGEYSSFRDNSNEMFFANDVKSLNKRSEADMNYTCNLITKMIKEAIKDTLDATKADEALAILGNILGADIDSDDIVDAVEKEDFSGMCDNLEELFETLDDYNLDAGLFDAARYIQSLGNDVFAGVFSKVVNLDASGYTYYYDPEYISWAGATQIARMVNCEENYGRHDYFNFFDKNSSDVNYCSLLASLAGKKDDVDFELKYDSSDSNGKLNEFVEGWYNKNKDEVNTVSSKLEEIKGTNEKLKKVADEVDKSLSSDMKKYVFDSSYSISDAINDMDIAYDAITYLLDPDNIKFISPDSSCTRYKDKDKDNYNELIPIELSGPDGMESSIIGEFYCETFNKQIDNIKGVNIINSASKKPENLPVYIEFKLMDLVKNMSGSSEDFFALEDTLRDYAVLYTKLSLYLYSNRVAYNINSVDLNLLKRLKDKYSDLVADKFGVDAIVVDCESLIGTELLDKINSYLDIIKIAIPIIIIGMGIMDFLKAMFSNDEENMRKIQIDFFKRIAIAFLIFLSPSFINLLLSIANKVWFFINPNSCGIFQ